jgi:hypothetical protein
MKQYNVVSKQTLFVQNSSTCMMCFNCKIGYISKNLKDLIFKKFIDIHRKLLNQIYVLQPSGETHNKKKSKE